MALRTVALGRKGGKALVAGSVAASLGLVVTFLALGGGSYAPAKVGDPCEPRHHKPTQDLQGEVEQFTVSALDGAACELHVSRETLVLALTTPEGRQRLAGDPRLQEAVRSGLLRAIDDAERAGALTPAVAGALRVLARNAPIDQLVGLLRDAAPIFQGLGGLLEGIAGPLPGQLGSLTP